MSRKMSCPTVGSRKLSCATLASRKISYPTVGSRKISYPTVVSRKMSCPTVESRKLSSQTVGTISETKETVRFNTRIAIIGSNGAGKSSILSTFVGHESVLKHDMPVQGFTNAIYHDGKQVVALDILDHSSTYKREALDYPGIATCDVFIIVFTVGNMESFEDVVKLRQQIMLKSKNGKKSFVAVIGNKRDLHEEQNSSDSIITELIVSCDWEHLYFETSVLNEQCIVGCFRKIIKSHLIQSGQLQNNNDDMNKVRTSSCPSSITKYQQRKSLPVMKKYVLEDVVESPIARRHSMFNF